VGAAEDPVVPVGGGELGAPHVDRVVVRKPFEREDLREAIAKVA
jgi:hypothetical protein